MSDIGTRAKELLTGAAPGPWVVERDLSQHLAYDLPIYDAKESPVAVCPDCGVRGGFETGTAEFIAASPQLVQELVDEVGRLRAVLTRTRDAEWANDPWSPTAIILHYELTGETVSERFPDDSDDSKDEPWQLADPQMWAKWFSVERDQARAERDRARAQLGAEVGAVINEGGRYAE